MLLLLPLGGFTAKSDKVFAVSSFISMSSPEFAEAGGSLLGKLTEGPGDLQMSRFAAGVEEPSSSSQIVIFDPRGERQLISSQKSDSQGTEEEDLPPQSLPDPGLDYFAQRQTFAQFMVSFGANAQLQVQRESLILESEIPPQMVETLREGTSSLENSQGTTSGKRVISPQTPGWNIPNLPGFLSGIFKTNGSEIPHQLRGPEPNLSGILQEERSYAPPGLNPGLP